MVAVLDACVLAPMPLCDTLLRWAEEVEFFRPRWSVETLEEVGRTLAKFGRSKSQIERRLHFMQEAFPESSVQISPQQIQAVPEIPDCGDKHVIAAAIQARASLIVTFNLRHFPASALQPRGIEVCSPDTFLVRQYFLAPERMLKVLDIQARCIEQRRVDILERLRRGLPHFTALVEEQIQC
jgi:predicted nucleic acid-binding protein